MERKSLCPPGTQFQNADRWDHDRLIFAIFRFRDTIGTPNLLFFSRFDPTCNIQPDCRESQEDTK